MEEIELIDCSDGQSLGLDGHEIPQMGQRDERGSSLRDLSIFSATG
jgi:hypothetical protein